MPEMNVEIFSVGTWAGSAGPMKFTLDDLEDIEKNFKTLKDVQDVPLKFGHNKKQPMTDGQPAIGWVNKIWVQGEKLMAHFTDVPELVAKAFKKKLYKNVSIELLFGVKFEGKKYLNVLDAVALLGADRPAVGNLTELAALMSARNSLESGNSMAFSSVTGNLNKHNEDDDMGELEDTKAKLAKSEEDLKKSQNESAEFSKKNDELTADAEKTATDTKVAEAKTKREEVEAVFNKAVEDKVIIPAQREAQFKLLNIDDDDAVMAIDLDAVKTSLSTEAVADFSKEEGKENKNGGERKHKDAGTELTHRANAAMTKDKDLSFGVAFNNELTNDPELGKEYQNLIPGGA